jgi:hypothetical protein
MSSPGPVSNVFPSTLPLDDMRLLHHWTAKASFSHSSTLGYNGGLWSVDIVEVAFEHPFLLHGLLAITAIHKSLANTEYPRAQLLGQADTHISICLETYTKNLEQPARETSLAMFLLSTVIVTYNLASAQIEEPDDPIRALLHCFRLHRGIHLAIGPFWAELIKTRIVTAMSAAIRDADLRSAAGYAEKEEIMRLKQLAAELDTEDADICVQTIEALHKAFVNSENCPKQEDKHSNCMRW